MHDSNDGFPRVEVLAGSVPAPDVSRALVDASDDPPAAPGLTDLQERFVAAFIETGGKIGESALMAGASHETYGHRLLARQKVQDEIARRVKLQSGSALAMAFGRLIKVVETGTDERAVVSAALGLMDRFGMAPPKASVTVNNNTAVIAGPQASAVLQMVAQRAAARLAQDSGA